jgi:hypothetical protein
LNGITSAVEKNEPQTDNSEGITLHPLKFNEAVSDLLKVKPQEKPPKKSPKPKRKKAK